MTRDMYGHLIHVADNDGAGGFGVSLTWHGRPDTPMTPVFTVFHESDGYRQALFSIDFEEQEGPLGGGRRPRVVNVFDDRTAEVLALVQEGTT